MDEYEFRRKRSDNDNNKSPGPIHDYEQYMYGGYRDRIEENSPNATIPELDEDDAQILALLESDLESEPDDEVVAVNYLDTQAQGDSQPSSPDNEPGIVITSGSKIAVPGTTTTYTVDIGDHLEPSSGFTYQWTVINDTAAVARERSEGNSHRVSEEVYFPETRDASFDAPWAFEGTHTVVVRVFYEGRLRDTYSYEQEVVNAEFLAAEALNEQTAPGLQPDVYIAQLELARQIAESQGTEEKDLQQIDEAIANAESHLGITEDNPTGNAEPITATLIPTAQPTPVPLQLYLKPEDNGVWAIVDLTDPGNARTYRGRGNRSAESTNMSAITHAWENFIARNPHPEGQIAGEINHSQTGTNVPLMRNDQSDGISELGKIGQWFSRVGLVAGIGAIALTVAPVPGSRVAAGLIIVSGASAAAAGGLNIADRLQHGNFEWDGETALDIVDIAAGLAVGVGTAVQLGGKAANIARLRNTVLISEGIETGSDAASGVILSAIHYRRIEEIRNSNLPEAEKQAQIEQELTLASANGGLILIGAVGLRRGNKGDYLNINADGFGTTSTAGAGRLRVDAQEITELRAIGLDNAEFQRLQDPNLPAAEKQALIAQHQTAFADLMANFDEGTIQTFVQRLGGKGFRQVYSATGNEGLRTVIEVLELEKQGRITGFDDWVSFLNKGNRDNTNITNLVAELSETKRLSTEISDGEVINIGGDAQVVPRRDGSIPPSYDLTVENQAGEVTRNIDVTTASNMVTRPIDLTTGIRHAVEKADAADGGTIESTVRVDLPPEGHVVSQGGIQKNFGRGGRYTIIDPSGTARRTGADTFEGEGDLIEDVRVYLNDNNITDSDVLNRLNLVDKSGSSLATFEKINGRWVITERGI